MSTIDVQMPTLDKIRTLYKRSGSPVPFDFTKVRRTIVRACEGLEGCSPSDLELNLSGYLQDGLSSGELMRTLIQVAVEKTSVEQPNWQFVAARLLLAECYKEAGRNRGYVSINGYGEFYPLIVKLEEMGRYGGYIRATYSRDEIDELGMYIQPKRDLLFNYVGLKQLMDRYVIKGQGQEILELPQELFMGVAMHLAMNESDRLTRAKQFYDVLCKLEATVATPTLSNARKPFHQLSSCFIDMPQDDLVSIYETDKAFARVSKFGGGMGIYVGKIRARGSAIRNHKGASGGVIPWVKNYNNTAVSCNQLGVRSGAVAIYLDVWHKDIHDFLQLRTNNGDERLKAHDIFPGVCIPDEFMRRVESRDMWYLFCPYEVEREMGFRLEDSWGDEFEKRYQACIDHSRLDRVEVPAIDIMKRIMQSAFETGTPFIFFRDTANRLNPNKHAGMIYCSNLCTEIMQNMSPLRLTEESSDDGTIVVRYEPGDFVVCNLSSLNIGRCHSREQIERIVSAQIRSMDNVIDLNFYPVKQAEITNRKYRAIGLGVSGYHQYLAQRGIVWESEEHLHHIDELFEWINYFAIKASMELAKEKGPYPLFEGSDWHTGDYFDHRNYRSREGGPDWDWLRREVQEHGIRNAYLFAIAPTSSTSLIAGSTAGIDPVFSRFFLEEKKNGVIPQTAPNLNEQTFWYYKEAHTIDQIWSIRACAVRQRHIDQSQSFNLYITPDIHVRDFLNLYVQAWKNVLKTVYYVRSQSVEVEDCVACSS
ncbi:ribonucleoside-diphosphate reductase subunit alpha [Alicyclobacillus dauci]|uniref:Ribonucleoside-diphosphate reductase n=1 Tax=Alicyclobacillus dauci TaxID=1475485 RepID=A0ABY6Z0I1_9BACL|nr:ribonucleoside-diphosphate reductase subunit alpha [Alicyclobacillus dauci]WAH36265.1 ribonucleoside-diphosphate reductase subunit alpha [Alicyclobacillus dauci]WAH39414.1 ribonucleoside-diphosphate reductase subunit alpha [Alicyclobacillus dauci]